MRGRTLTFIDELARHVHPRKGQKEFCMVEAYMDESGIQAGAHVCVIAGYWGSAKKWRRFEKRWPQILKEANEPTLTEFHSTKFWNSRGERHGVFAKWSESKADKFIEDLVGCIVDTEIFPTSCVLVIDEWNKLNQNERRLLTGGRYDPTTERWIRPGAPNKTYFWPFQLAIAAAASHCKPGLHVHYTFDLNKQFKNHAANLFALLKADPTLNIRHRLGTLDMEVSQIAVGLQAADLFAYQTYKVSKWRIKQPKTPRLTDAPVILQQLLTNAQSNDDFPFFDREGLNVALDSLPRHLRSSKWTPTVIRRRPIS
jgi:hypothetical protein